MNDSSSASEKLFDEIQQAAQQGKGLRFERTVSPRHPIPGYLILEEIHRGGQGVVFKAIQESTKRTVALKFILQGSFATERQRFRFEREIDLASRLNHPNIVTIFDGGIGNNQPFYAMEFVDGQPLNRFDLGSAAASPWTRKVVELFLKICEAVGYAHSRGVVHRDLKPANILVDQSGEPHILDFGLAKVMDAEGSHCFSPHTMTGEFVGTLSYASPEQAKANPELTDTRSDVYSLGVVFYELLTGSMPYDVSGAIVEILTNIESAEPARLRKVRSAFDADIETILLKALSKDPERRYQSASLLADDLRHYLSGEPIEARRDSSWYVLRKAIIRNRRAAIAVVSFVALLISALVVISILYFQAIRDRDIASRAKLDEQKQLQIAERETAAAVAARKLEVAGREEAEFRTYVAHMAASDSSIRIYDVQDALRNLSHAPEKHRGFEWWYLLGQIDRSEMSLGGLKATGELPFTGDYRTVDYSPDGKWIAAGNAAGKVFLWKTFSKLVAAHFDVGASVQRLRFHPNGSQIAIGLSAGDALLVDISSDSSDVALIRSAGIRYSTEGSQLHALEFSPDGESLILGCGTHPDPGCVLIYETETGKRLRSLGGHDNPVWSVAVSRDGHSIASADNDIRIWDFETGNLLGELPGHQNWVWDLAFHPDSRQLASCALEQEIKIWDLASGELGRSLVGHTSFVNALEYSEDGSQLATVSEDRTIRFWETSGYTTSVVKWGHVGGIGDIAFGPEGQLATAGSLCVKTWSPQPEDESSFAQGYYRKIMDVDISPDSKQILAADDRGALVEWKLASRRLSRIVLQPPEPNCAIRSVSYSPTHKFAAWSNDDGKICIFQFENRQTDVLDGHAKAVNSIAITANGAVLYSASDDRTVLRWNVESKSSNLFCESEWAIRNVQVSPDGKWVATSGERGITLWDSASGKLVAEIPFQPGSAADNIKLAFHPASAQIAATLPPDDAGVWTVPGGMEVSRMSENTQNIQSLAWSPDGKRLAIASRNGTIKIWDSQRFQVVLTIRGFSGYCETVAFSPDNLRLVGGMYDGSIRLWNTLPLERRLKE